MLSAPDETLLHQDAVPFSQTRVSDHRFFDRMYIGAHHRDHLHFVAGMGVYKNTNTLDGFFCVIKDGKQHNLRVSRPLAADPAAMSCGPLKIEIVEPLQAIRVTVEAGPGQPIAADVMFSGTFPVSMEAPHQARVDGRIVQDYQRYDQLGRVNGWVEHDGQRIAVNDWFATRDHSWGVRPSMGGYDAPTSLPRSGENLGDVGAGQVGFLVVVLWFEVASMGGFLMRMENGKGEPTYSHGRILKRVDGAIRDIETRSIRHDLRFVEGTRTAQGGTITVETVEGETISIEVESIYAPYAYKGTGYDCGFDDERGLGVHRGWIVETDTYDISHPEDVILPDGRTIRPWHRELGAVVRVNGEEGMAHFPVISSGPIERYGLDAPTTNRRGG